AYDDSTCRNCHGSLLSVTANMSEFTHNVAVGVAGGANCTNCHDLGGSAGEGRIVDFSATNDSSAIHKNLNNGAATSLSSVNKKCWACHGNGNEPGAGHPANYNNPKNCNYNDCHSLSQSRYNESMVYSHFRNVSLNGNPGNATNYNITAAVPCEICHVNSLVKKYTASSLSHVSHYGSKTDLVDSFNCIYCHLDRDNSIKWGNATEINKNMTSRVEMDKIKNKFTAHEGEFVDLGLGYRIKVAGISAKRGSAIIELYQRDNLVDISLANIGSYVYEETRIIDNASSRIPVIVLNITEMFVSDNVNFIQFEGFRIKRVHSENRITSCYLCHYQANATKHKFTVIDRVDKNVFYTEVLFNSSDRNEYDQQQALQILANKTPHDIYTNIEGAKRKTLHVGEIWKLTENYSLTLKNVAENSDSASFLLEAGGENFTNIVKKGGIFDYEPAINYLGYAYTKIVIFRANVSEISQDIVVLEDIMALSPDIIKIDVNSTIYGHNASWLWKNNSFLTGMIPSDLHAPLLRDGKDGGADCTSCHNVGELGSHKDVNLGAASSVASDNKACWACHGDGSEPKWHPALYKKPRECRSCHVERVVTYNATYIGDERHGALMNCSRCHVEDTHKIKRFDVTPGIRRLSVSKEVVYAGEKITIGATAAAGYEMRIRDAEYYIDTPDKLNPMAAADGSFDEQIEEVTAEINTSGLKPGNHLIYVRAMERDNRWGHESSISVSVEEKTPTVIDRIIEKTPALIKTRLQKIVESKSHWVNFSVALILFSFALYKLIQYKKALKGYEKAKEMSPETADEWYNKGFDLYKLGNYEGAIKAYDKALDITRKMRNLTNNRQK
ncbi:MAG: tetratricopeptide repeat protein, partial [Candidatus Methanoperedens sp.]